MHATQRSVPYTATRIRWNRTWILVRGGDKVRRRPLSRILAGSSRFVRTLHSGFGGAQSICRRWVEEGLSLITQILNHPEVTPPLPEQTMTFHRRAVANGWRVWLKCNDHGIQHVDGKTAWRSGIVSRKSCQRGLGIRNASATAASGCRVWMLGRREV